MIAVGYSDGRYTLTSVAVYVKAPMIVVRRYRPSTEEEMRPVREGRYQPKPVGYAGDFLPGESYGNPYGN